MKKIIGVCLTETRSEYSREFIKFIYKHSKINDVKVIIYNSICNFSADNLRGARAVYYNIPYEKLDAIVIVHECFADSSLVDKILRYAKAANTPVIMAGKYDPRCYSIVGDYEDVYTDMLKKIIKDRNVSESLYIAGRNEPEIDFGSKIRIQCYKNALEECGYEFNVKNVYFCGYDEAKVHHLIDKMIKNKQDIPKAIFCANDRMAQTVMDVLKEHDYKIPQDFIVAGFDGMECFKCSAPNLSTCQNSLDDLCLKIFDAFNELKGEGTLDNTFYYNYNAIFSESCGYSKPSDLNNDIMVNDLYSTIKSMDIQMLESSRWSGFMLYKASLNKFYSQIDTYLKANFQVALTPLEVAKVINKKYHALEDSMVLYSIDSETGMPKTENYITKQIVPNLEEWMEDDTMYFVTSLMVDGICYGLIYEKGSGNVSSTGYSVNDHAGTLIKVLTASANED